MRIYTFAEIKDRISVNGRTKFYEDGAMLCSWSYSGFELSGDFNGEVSFSYELKNCTECCFHIVIDGDENGERLIRLNGQSGKCEIAKLSGKHTVELSKAGEAMTGTAFLKKLYIDGDIDEMPPKKSIFIETIGDSISAGQKLKGPDGLDNDGFFSYEAYLARKINAKLSIIAASGWGLSCGGRDYNSVIPKIYGKTAFFAGEEEKWDFENNRPDAVLMNLGTNDYIYESNGKQYELIQNANAFLDFLRTVYPTTKIYWLYGMMYKPLLSCLREIVISRNDENLMFLDMKPNLEGIGEHPIYTAHSGYADILSKILKRDFEL